MPSTLRTSCLLAVCLGLASPSIAQVVHWKAGGKVDVAFANGVLTQPPRGIERGDIFSVEFLVDQSAESFGSDWYYDMYPVARGSAQIGSHQYTFDPLSRLTVSDNAPLYHAYFMNGFFGHQSVNLSLSGTQTGEAGTELPTEIPPLATYNVVRNLSFNFVAEDGVRWSVYAPLDFINLSTPSIAAVPEPSTYGWMAAAALVGVICLRRRRRT